MEFVCKNVMESFDRSMPELLAALLDRSLIQRVPDPNVPARFSMLEMIREYALQRLEEDGLIDDARERHATFFQTFALESVPHLYRENQAFWLERLERDIGNIRAAMQWRIEQGEQETALQLAADLENFWLVHDHLSEGQRWSRKVSPSV